MGKSVKPVQYGGQAVIEGVMMRGPRMYAIAVRLPNGQIDVTKQDISGWASKPVFKWPVIRGCVALIDALIVGVKALTFSANKALEEEENAESTETIETETATGKKNDELGWLEIVVTVGIALVLGLVLFVGIPTASAHFLRGFVPQVVWQNILEGFIRLGIFFLYILAISRLKDIQRVFQYHGAEHKVIFNHESGQPLSVENARAFSRLHPRCGTSFLLLVVVVSIFVFALLGLNPLWWRILSRVLLMPLVAGIAYEWLKLTARHLDSPWLRWMIAGGLWLQRFTTREPDDAQLAVAIAALNGVLESGQELA
ncbi:MAG: DUF1385 domain-containing protein [Peptococcaceae bacterium]|jgi:uncharacterized protein YqhQ|nr:DUF1385 domain-containing protein [Peptococcaceae bacterium]